MNLKRCAGRIGCQRTGPVVCSGQAIRLGPVGVRRPRYTGIAVEVGIGLGAHSPQVPVAPARSAHAEVDDAALVAGLTRGETRALERVYERHSRAVYSLALHLLADPGAAEEVAQETFLKLWRQPAAYQPERGKLSSWLLGVAHHHAVDILRRRQLELRYRAKPAGPDADRTQDAMESLVQVSDDVNPEVRAGLAEQRLIVADALASLPAEQRVPLELAYYRGLTQVEIASTLQQPLGTIKTRMRLALQKLRGAPGLADHWHAR